jgi:polo-like kinase 1
MEHSDASEDELAEYNEEIEERIIKFNGDEIVKRYLKGRFLGKGGFAKCYEFKCLNNKKIYAAKIVSKSNLSKQSAKSKLKSEIKIHKSLFHSHIVKFEHVFEDSENVYILLELCKNKTLNELLKRRKIITELEVKYYLDQILKAVKFMHKNKIIHRDLKLGNLFINEKMEIKIGDFGLATTISYEGEKRYTICGTPNYIAPEILEGKALGHSYEVDYWAIGVIVYTLLIGRPPFETEEVKETYKRIQNNMYSFPSHIYISPEAKDFVQAILLSKANLRLNLDAMRSHSFMSKTSIPKSLPEASLKFPPSFKFYRQYLLLDNKMEDLNNLSTLNDSHTYNRYLQDLRDFALKNMKRVECNLVNENVLIREKTGLNKTMNKESHSLLKFPIEKVHQGQINYIKKILDYSSLGYFYQTNQNIIGIFFNDKSSIYKCLNNDEFYYLLNPKKLHKKTNVNDLKDTPSETKMKLSALLSYEKFVMSENLKLQDVWEQQKRKFISIKKVICTDLSYILKLSNKNIQVFSFKFLVNF